MAKNMKCASWLIVTQDQLAVRDMALDLGNGDEASDALHQMLGDIEFAAGAFDQLAELC